MSCAYCGQEDCHEHPDPVPGVEPEKMEEKALIFDIKDGRYIAAMWFCADKEKTQDWHAALIKNDEGRWELRYRFRYYVDDKAHDSDDVKNAYVVRFPEGYAEKDCMEVVKKVADSTSAYYGTPMHKVILRTSRAKDVVKALSREKWVHARFEEAKKGAGR